MAQCYWRLQLRQSNRRRGDATNSRFLGPRDSTSQEGMALSQTAGADRVGKGQIQPSPRLFKAADGPARSTAARKASPIGAQRNPLTVPAPDRHA